MYSTFAIPSNASQQFSFPHLTCYAHCIEDSFIYLELRLRWLDVLTGTRSQSDYGVRIIKDGLAALAAPVSVFKPHVDPSAMSVTAILTTRTPDRQGDIVDPEGGDFSEHRTNPVVMFHHGKQYKLPIGKAEDRNGNYTVRMVKSADGPVLVGTTHFAQSSRFAQDVFGLVAEDILRGVSIGFDPLEGSEYIEKLGVSPVLERPALHFKGWKLLEYSHTPLGVNRDALTVAVQKALDGSRKLEPSLLKFLQPMAAPRKTVVAVRLPVEKAMPMPAQAGQDEDEDQQPLPEGEDEQGFDPATDSPDDDPNLPPNYAGNQGQDEEMPPTVQTLTDGAQGLLDLCSAIEAGMKKSEHMKGRKYAGKLCADLKKTAAEVSSFADKIHGELSGAPMDADADQDTDTDGDGDVPESDKEDAESETPDEPDTDEDGAIMKKGYSPRRWTYADLAATGPVVTQPAPANTRQFKALQAEHDELKRMYENLLSDVEAGGRRRTA